MNLNKLKGKITEAGLTRIDFANKLGINPATLSRKLSKEGCTGITVREVEKISNVLKLNKDEVVEIFFTKK